MFIIISFLTYQLFLLFPHLLGNKTMRNAFVHSKIPIEHHLSYKGRGMTQTTMISLNRGLTIQIYNENKMHRRKMNTMGLNAHNTFGCIVNYLFQPKPEIFDQVKQQYNVMMSKDPNVIKIGLFSVFLCIYIIAVVSDVILLGVMVVFFIR